MVTVESRDLHSFISRLAVEEFGVEVEPTPEFIVEMGDGWRMMNKQICKEVEQPN